MQSISRVSKIDFRLFSGFAWPTGLSDFARFNLIYGWNASGKTTLSSLFRLLETCQNLIGGSAEFVVGDLKCDLAKISCTTSLPKVRVFNRDFISANVLTSQLAPIFYLGAESIEKQKMVEGLKAQVAATSQKQVATESKLDVAKADFESFCQQQAKLVKELLSSSGGNNPPWEELCRRSRTYPDKPLIASLKNGTAGNGPEKKAPSPTTQKQAVAATAGD